MATITAGSAATKVPEVFGAETVVFLHNTHASKPFWWSFDSAVVAGGGIRIAPGATATIDAKGSPIGAIFVVSTDGDVDVNYEGV